MGQKINPTAFRIGIKIPGIRRETANGIFSSNAINWRSRWFAPKKDFGRLLTEDAKIRRHVHKQYKAAGISRVEIERSLENVTVFIHAARPGVLIGRKGAKIDALRGELIDLAGGPVDTKVLEVPRPETDAQLVAENVAEQLERRASFRRTLKKTVEQTMQMGALGCRIRLSGRLGGAEIARSEVSQQGQIPLTTLRADVDYGFAEAKTSYGHIGVKCWIYRGDMAPDRESIHAVDAQAGQAPQDSPR
jgi:small subunit ribosomal protein S3